MVILADVLRARLKTTGVVEHTFSLPKNKEFLGGVEWKIYDVGGVRDLSVRRGLRISTTVRRPCLAIL